MASWWGSVGVGWGGIKAPILGNTILNNTWNNNKIHEVPQTDNNKYNTGTNVK
jgi:hypothetical protein